jgi:chaperonin GroEL
MKNIKDGVNAVELKNGMKKAGELVVAELTKNAIAISSKQEVSQVASISAQDEKV